MFSFARRICACVPLLMGLPVLLAAQATQPEKLENSLHSAPIDVAHGKPFVMVMVNGKGPFRFVIDTGTGGEAFITSELAERLGLPAAGRARLRDPSGQGGQRVPMVLIQSLQVAGVEFTSVKAAVHKLSDGDGDYQGLLGFLLFRDYLLTLDFPNRRMALASGALEGDGERSVLTFRMPDGVPIVPMRIGGIEIDAQIDSGGSGLSLPEQFTSRLKFNVAPAAFGNGQSLSTRFQIKAAQLASDVQLGSYTFAKPFVEINPAFPLANFGSCPMQNFVVTFDQKSGLVRFDARQKMLPLAATPSPMHMQLAPASKPPDPALVPVG
jgi:predicted aspartyl protease